MKNLLAISWQQVIKLLELLLVVVKSLTNKDKQYENIKHRKGLKE